MPADPTDTVAERRAGIERMIEHYRRAKQRRLVRRAVKLWRQAEARQELTALEAAPERVH